MISLINILNEIVINTPGVKLFSIVENKLVFYKDNYVKNPIDLFGFFNRVEGQVIFVAASVLEIDKNSSDWKVIKWKVRDGWGGYFKNQFNSIKLLESTMQKFKVPYEVKEIEMGDSKSINIIIPVKYVIKYSDRPEEMKKRLEV